MVGQQHGQLNQGVIAARSGALAQLIELVPLSQPAGQPELGCVVPGVGQGPDDLDGLLRPGALGQPPGQLPSRVVVSGRGPLTELIGLVVLGQQIGLPPALCILGVLRLED